MYEVSWSPDQTEHVFKGVVVFFEIYEGSCRKAPGPELICGIDAEGGEAVGVFIRIGIEQNGVNYAEDGGRRADTEGERQDCGAGEDGRFAKLAEGEAAVGEEGPSSGGDRSSAGHCAIVGQVERKTHLNARD